MELYLERVQVASTTQETALFSTMKRVNRETTKAIKMLQFPPSIAGSCSRESTALRVTGNVFCWQSLLRLEIPEPKKHRCHQEYGIRLSKHWFKGCRGLGESEIERLYANEENIRYVMAIVEGVGLVYINEANLMKFTTAERWPCSGKARQLFVSLSDLLAKN